MSILETKLSAVETAIKEHSIKTGQRVDDLQKQFDSLVLEMRKPGNSTMSHKTIGDVVRAIQEDAGFDLLRKNGRGRAIIEVANLLEVKAAITSGTVVPYAHEGGIAATGRKRYRLRQRIRSTPITTGSAHFVRETAFTDAASPQIEAANKAESEFTFEADTADVRTLAHWTQASKQVLEDLDELGNHIETSLLYGLEREFEEQVLLGDGTGQNFEGLTVNATAYDSTILSASDGYEYADVLGAAALQLEEAGYECDTLVVSPRVWFTIMRQKNANGDYIFGSPATERMKEILWNCVVVPSHAMANDKFLAGDFANGCHIRMRQQSTIDISDSHSDFFIKNLLAIRGELRAAFVKTKPAAFVYGTLAQSPA